MNHTNVALDCEQHAGLVAQLEAILGSVADGVIVYDLQGRIVRTNAAADEILGYDEGERAAPISERIRSGRYEWLTEDGTPLRGEESPASRAALRGETHRGVVLRMRSATDERWLRASAGPLVVDGVRVGAVVTLSDITDRQRGEDALARLAAIVENTEDAIVSKDLAGRIRSWNAAAERLLGHRADEVIGRPIDLIIPPERRHEEARILARVQAGERVERFDTQRVRKDGTLLDVSVVVSPVRDGAGRIVGASKIVRDITAAKRAEAELREMNERLLEADRRKDEFLGMLSHELRNPLAPIRNSIYILRRASPSGVQAQRALEVIERQSNHMTRLVDDLLDVTRIARGKIELRRERVDACDVVRRTGEDHRSLFADREIALSIDVPDAPVWVCGDPTRLAQMVGNLLQNAAKFTGHGGRVALSARLAGARLEIAVRDDGVGIEPELLEHVFEPFVQAERTLARSSGGLGLGLALVKGLAKLHGGDVTVESEGPGHGTEFRVALPPLAAPAREAPAGVPTAARGPRHRVLVVDDNHDAADSLAEIVELFGHEVEVAHDGPAAIAKARAHRPDVILCDIGLPGMDGYEVARELRAGGATDQRLVAVSGYAQPEDVARAMEAGFDEHVAKPPSIGELERLLA